MNRRKFLKIIGATCGMMSLNPLDTIISFDTPDYETMKNLLLQEHCYEMQWALTYGKVITTDRSEIKQTIPQFQI